MKQHFIRIIGIVLLGVLAGCETVKGVSRDLGNTARNVRDVIGVGRDIESITK